MKNFKTILVIAIVSLAVLSIAGCKKKPPMEKIPDAPAPPSTAETAPAPLPPAPSQTPDFDAMKSPSRLDESELGWESEFKLENVYFEFDKYNLSPEAQATLAKIAKWLKDNPAAKIRIEGHCDERGTLEYNLALGERRALSAKGYLINLGAPSARMTTISFGKERPADPRSNETAWAKNRRCEFLIIR